MSAPGESKDEEERMGEKWVAPNHQSAAGHARAELEHTKRDAYYALLNLVEAVKPVLGAHRSSPGRVTQDEITQAWAAFDAACAVLNGLRPSQVEEGE